MHRNKKSCEIEDVPVEVVELDEDAYKQDGTDTQLDAAVRYIMDKLQ